MQESESRLISGLELMELPGERLGVIDRAKKLLHGAPKALLNEVRSAFEAGGTKDPRLTAWLEARHLVRSERVARVEAWALAQSRALAASDVDKRLIISQASRFTCHACGLCCRTYTLAPVREEERAAIMNREAELAPHVPTAAAEWFKPYEEDLPVAGRLYRLNTTADGACVFLGKDNLCTVHRVLGGAVKPHICQAFPLDLTRTEEGTRVTLRVECETFSRSEDDGAPLAEQLPWVESIVTGAFKAPGKNAGLVEIPLLVRVSGEAHVPFALARVINDRAIHIVETAPTIELGLLAIRDLTFAIQKTLGPTPDAAELDRARRLALEGSPEVWAELLGELLPEKSLESLGPILTASIKGLPAHLDRTRETGRDVVSQKAHHEYSYAVMRGLFAALAERFQWKVGKDLFLEEVAEERRKAAGIPLSLDEPKVIAFLRTCLREILSSYRPLASSGGLIFGFAQLTLTYALVRFGARVRASRRGAERASREDWNHAFATFDRLERNTVNAGLEPYVLAYYENAFFTDDLPS